MIFATVTMVFLVVYLPVFYYGVYKRYWTPFRLHLFLFFIFIPIIIALLIEEALKGKGFLSLSVAFIFLLIFDVIISTVFRFWLTSEPLRSRYHIQTRVDVDSDDGPAC